MKQLHFQVVVANSLSLFLIHITLCTIIKTQTITSLEQQFLNVLSQSKSSLLLCSVLNEVYSIF